MTRPSPDAHSEGNAETQHLAAADARGRGSAASPAPVVPSSLPSGRRGSTAVPCPFPGGASAPGRTREAAAENASAFAHQAAGTAPRAPVSAPGAARQAPGTGHRATTGDHRSAAPQWTSSTIRHASGTPGSALNAIRAPSTATAANAMDDVAHTRSGPSSTRAASDAGSSSPAP